MAILPMLNTDDITTEHTDEFVATLTNMATTNMVGTTTTRPDISTMADGSSITAMQVIDEEQATIRFLDDTRLMMANQ